jgi:hypothetical protein
MHPHDTFVILRIAYKEETDRAVVKQNLSSAIDDAVQIFKRIGSIFGSKN